MTENSDKLDNMTVRRFAKLIKGNSTSNGSTGITTGTVIQNDNQLYVAVDDETLVPVSDTASNVNVGDKVTLAIDNEEALIVGNNSDASPTASELSETDTKATFAKVDASEAKDTAQTAQVTANTAQNTAETAQTTADNAQSTATEAKETADAVDGKATEAKETATQAQATATTASETATQAKETAEAVDAKATEAQTTATEAQTTANTAQTTANTAKETADTAQTTAETAQASADDARKHATNYIDIDENKGITVGDMTAGTLGKNTYITADGIAIRDNTTELASFTDSEIYLGKNSNNSIIHLGKSFCQIQQGATGQVNLISQDGFLLYCFDGGFGRLNLDNGAFSWEGEVRNKNADGTFETFYPVNFYVKNREMIIGDQCDNPKVIIKGKDTDGTLECAEIKKNGTSVAVEGHTHTTSDLTDADTLAKTGHKHTVSDITDYEPFDPSDYAKASHTHTQSDITDFAHTHTKSDITDFSHTHTKSEISDFAHDHTDEDLYPYSVHAKNDIRVHDTVVSLNGHNHAGDALTPATINTTSTIKQNGTQVSLEGHTHEAKDLTTSTPILKVVTSTSSSVTASKQSSFVLNCPIPTVAGYTLVGCVSWTTNQGATLMRRSYKSGSNWTLLMYNVSTTSITVTGTVQLLFAKEGWV